MTDEENFQTSEQLSKIGYVIPTLGNNLEWLDEALASIRNYDSDSKIVIVSKILQDQLKTLAHRYKSEIVLEREEGVYAAINQGIEVVQSLGVKYFAFLGDDDILMPNAGKNLLKAFDEERVVAAYGEIWYVDEDLNVLMKNGGYPWLHRFLAWVPNIVPNPGTIISIAAWREVGGYRTNLRWAGDLDFWLRVKKNGKFKFVDVPMSMFRWHNASLTKGQRNLSLQEATKVRKTHTPKYLMPIRIIWEIVITKLGEYLTARKMKQF